MDNNTIQPPPYPDLTLAKIGLKLRNVAIELGIDEYQDDCVDVIFDYTIIYMKSVIRSMARHKRKYKVVCPILTGKSEKNEYNTIKKEYPEEKLWPWQVKINWDVVREENIKFLDANDFKDVKEKDSQMDESFDREATLKTVDENSSNVDKKTKSTSNKRSCEEYTEKTVKKKTNECVISEIMYSPNKFDMMDLAELLKMDAHVIPLRSIYEIFNTTLREKLTQKMRF